MQVLALPDVGNVQVIVVELIVARVRLVLVVPTLLQIGLQPLR